MTEMRSPATGGVGRLLRRLRLAARLLWLNLAGRVADPTRDYDAAAATFDYYYTPHFGPLLPSLVWRLPIAAGQTVADIGSGTGALAHLLARRVGPAGRVVAVESAPAMLAENRRKAAAEGLANVEPDGRDGLDYLAGAPDLSLDGVAAAWAVAYLDRPRFFRQAFRALRPGGWVGVLENVQPTLAEAMAVMADALAACPAALCKRVGMRLPRAEELPQAARRAGFAVGCLWDGRVTIPAATGQDVLDYLRLGAVGAGFLDAIRPDLRDRVETEFRRLWDAAPGRVPTHHYVGLVCYKPDTGREEETR